MIAGLLRQKTSEKEMVEMSMVTMTNDIRVLQTSIAAKDHRLQQLTSMCRLVSSANAIQAML